MAAPLYTKISERLNETFGVIPKDFQLKCIAALIREQDVFLSTRTGGGKSLCYHGFPSVWRDLHGGERCSVLVVTPLLSIMKEQCDYLEENGYKASYIGRSDEGDMEILSGSMDFVFSSPENLLSVDR